MPDEPKKEWDNMPGWVPYAMKQFEKMTDRISFGGSGISFVITRAELHLHLVDRAEHWESEAKQLADRDNIAKVAEIRKKLSDALGLVGPRVGFPAGFDQKAMEEQARERMLADAELRTKMFAFAAAHLVDVERFVIDLSTASYYELIPSARENYGAVIGGPMLAGA